MFKKLNYTFPSLDYTKLKGPLRLSYGRISYYHFKDFEYFNSLVMPDFPIPPAVTQYCEIIGSGHLEPHVDHRTLACVNYYFEPNDSLTFFYEKKEETVKGNFFPGEKTQNIYNFADVTKVGQFIAEQDSMYLLDVSKIHSVLALASGTRRFITWQWPYNDYEEILNSLPNTLTT